MKTKIIIVSLSFVFLQVVFSTSIFSREKDVFGCAAKVVAGDLPAAVIILQSLCVNETKTADASEKVKPGNGRKNLPNQTGNRTKLVYGGMQPDLKFVKLPKEAQNIVKLTFPAIASDTEQLYFTDRYSGKIS